MPEVCVLDFDGDLTDALVTRNEISRCDAWPCFHTSLWTLEIDRRRCGIIGRTIGGPFAVLVAEQLAVCGVRVVVGLASAGRVGSHLPVPGVVVADRAIRDEGTSYHYLAARARMLLRKPLAGLPMRLEVELSAIGAAGARRGLVWTTDAPYRETASQLERYARRGVLAVEMQAASLFAFAAARRVAVRAGRPRDKLAAPDHDGESFDRGSL